MEVNGKLHDPVALPFVYVYAYTYAYAYVYVYVYVNDAHFRKRKVSCNWRPITYHASVCRVSTETILRKAFEERSFWREFVIYWLIQ
jgi:hypothetical protein